MPSNNAATQPPGILPPNASIPNNTPNNPPSINNSEQSFEVEESIDDITEIRYIPESAVQVRI